MPHERKVVLPLPVGALTFDAISVAEVVDDVLADSPTAWRTVVTPNAHHLSLLRREPALMSLYVGNAYLLADGWPVAWLLSRRSSQKVTRASGADLLECLLARDGGGRRLLVVGGQDLHSLEALLKRARAKNWVAWGSLSPNLDLADEGATDDLIAEIRSRSDGGVVILGLGAPKQEILAKKIAEGAGRGYIMCLGQAVNFSAGSRKRAPRWVQSIGAEWLHRAATEPRRLVPRYLGDARDVIRLAWYTRR